MASGLPRIPTPSIVTPDEEAAVTQAEEHGYWDTGQAEDAGGSFLTTNAWAPSSLPPTITPAFLDPNRRSPSPRTGPFLHPSSHLLPSPRIYGNMTSEDSPADGCSAVPAPPNPFNFQTQVISTSPVKSGVGQRKGHRYKHSSISTQHQIFQEPPPRPPPVLPASLPVPTLTEAWASMQHDQRARLYWCLCHGAVAVYVFFSAEGSLAMTALSHLVFFDVGSAAVCVAVDVLGNFEVWRRSSVRHPFGLQRAEVLAGFAMSIFLVFGGFDLLSHNLKHVLEGVGDHAPHHPHAHPEQRVSPGAVDVASLAAVVSTLVSAYGLSNHARIARVMRVRLPGHLSELVPAVLVNPFHTLTVTFSGLLLMLPLLSIEYYQWLDRALCAAIALSMFVLGTRLAIAQGLMLLMSYSGRPRSSSRSVAGRGKAGSAGDGQDVSVSAVVREIEAEPHVARVEEAQFWQVHYGLGMANLKLCLVRGCDDGTLSQLRGRIARVIQNRLGEGYGRGGSLRWEVTVQMCTDGN